MDEPRTAPEPQADKTPVFRGLYRHVKISIRALDCVIVACILAILFVVAVELRDPGLTVTFDSKGGTDVPAQVRMYGELLEAPEPPTREGYRFTGWYSDASCLELWDMETMTIELDMTLYAGWENIE